MFVIAPLQLSLIDESFEDGIFYKMVGEDDDDIIVFSAIFVSL